MKGPIFIMVDRTEAETAYEEERNGKAFNKVQSLHIQK